MPLWAIGRYCKWSPWQKDSHGIKVSMTKRSPLQKLPRCKNLPIAQKGPHSKKVLLQKGPHCKNVPMGNRLLLKVPIAKSSAKQKCPYCKMSPLQEGPQSINVPNAKCPYCKTVPFSFHVMRERAHRGGKSGHKVQQLGQTCHRGRRVEEQRMNQ